MTQPRHDRDDAMLRALLRDAHAADPPPPDFTRLTQPRPQPSRWRVQLALTCVLLIVSTLALILARPSTAPHVPSQTANPDAMTLASLEDFARAAHTWEAPTDFLLNDPLGDYSLVTQPFAFEGSLPVLNNAIEATPTPESNP